MRSSFVMRNQKIRYYLALHSARFHSLSGPLEDALLSQDGIVGWLSTSFFPWCGRGPVASPIDWVGYYRERYLEDRPVEKKVHLFFDYLDRLPLYEEVCPEKAGVPFQDSKDPKFVADTMALISEKATSSAQSPFDPGPPDLILT